METETVTLPNEAPSEPTIAPEAPPPPESDKALEPSQNEPVTPAALPAKIEAPAPGLVHFNERQVDVLRNVICRDLNDYELEYFMARCVRLDLDPFAGQIYAWKDKGKVVTMTSIDGLRLIGDRSHKLKGTIGPMWCGLDGEWQLDSHGDPKPWLSDTAPAAARYGVLHKDHGETVHWGIATFDAFGRPARTKTNSPNGMWATPGGAAHMLAKCAEAIALRKAFPADLSGVYTDDEIPQAVEARRADADEPPAPGVGDPLVEDLVGKFEQLPPDAQAKIDAWWTEKYAPTFIRSRRNVPKISEGALYEWRGSSPHIVKASEIIGNAFLALGLTSKDSAVEAELLDDDDRADDEVEEDGIEEAELVDEGPNPAGADAFAIEDRIATTLEEIGAGTVAVIAEAMGLEDSKPIRGAVQSMFAAGELALMPDAPTGPRTYMPSKERNQ